MKRPWTDEEKAYLRAHIHDQTAAAMAYALGRSRSSVFTQCCRLGLVHQRLWTEEDDRKLAQALRVTSLETTAALLGRTVTATRQHAHKLGLSVATGRPMTGRSRA